MSDNQPTTCPSADTPSSVPNSGIYIASKVKHADQWRFLRDHVGEPIISTWIDEAGEGETSDHHDLWRRCISEASNCALLIVYREPGEVLKGAWVEMGCALANNIPVYAVGLEEYTIAKYRGITHFETMKEAIAASRRLISRQAAMARGESASCGVEADKETGKLIGAYLGMSGIDVGDVAYIRNLVTAPAQPSPNSGEMPSRDALIDLIMRETTDKIVADGWNHLGSPNVLIQGCKFVRRNMRTDPAEGYQDPEVAAKRFAGFIADAILADPALRASIQSAEVRVKAVPLSVAERGLLQWLSTSDGQYGECHGKTLDGLIARDFAVIQGVESGLNNDFIAKGTDIMYRAVSITNAGRAALATPDPAALTAGREEIARIIDPTALWPHPSAPCFRRVDALAKADAILALAPQSPPTSGGPVVASTEDRCQPKRSEQ